MKYFLLLASLLSFNAMAAHSICAFEDTTYFQDEVDERKIKIVKKSDNHKAFSMGEKALIHAMVKATSPEWTQSIHQSLIIFGDYYADLNTPGSNSGEINYYNYKGSGLVLVHFWPGDNEVGAFFEVKNGRPTLVATISDGWIECK